MEPLEEADPRQIGEYLLLGRLGEGGMGRVYLAQSQSGRMVAAKLVRRDVAEQLNFRRRFEREVRAARKVSGPWTAPLLDAETDTPQPWLATGYIPGISLYDAVDGQYEPLPERTLRVLANRMALALRSVHGAGLVHRDVKPSNILITLEGPRLIDFGIARALEVSDETQLTLAGAVVGSPAFMSPEQARGLQLTSASDIFSLGSVLRFAATGSGPFDDTGKTPQALLFRIVEEEPDLSGVPGELRQLLVDCLAKDPEARPDLKDIVARTADPEDAPGPDGGGDPDFTLDLAPDRERERERAVASWLPAGLVDRMERHTAELLDAKKAALREIAERRPDNETTQLRLPATLRPDAGPTASGTRSESESESRSGTDTGTGTGTETTQLRLPATSRPGDGPTRSDTAHLRLPAPASVPAPARASASAPDPDPAPAPAPAPVPAPASASAPASGTPGAWQRRVIIAISLVPLTLITGGWIFYAVRDAGPSGGDGPAPAESLKPAPGGAVPKEFLGNWQTKVTKASDGGPIFRRFEVRQGDKGDPVVKFSNVHANMLCKGVATLDSRNGRTAKLDTSTSTSHLGRPSCAPQKVQSLVYEADGSLRWTVPGTDKRVDLHRVGGDKATPVPDPLVGTWKPVGSNNALEKKWDRISFDQGPAGSASMRLVKNGIEGECVWKAPLSGADDGTLIYAGMRQVKGACGAGGAGGGFGPPFRVRMLGDDKVGMGIAMPPAGTKPSVLRPAD